MSFIFFIACLIVVAVLFSPLLIFDVALYEVFVVGSLLAMWLTGWFGPLE